VAASQRAIDEAVQPAGLRQRCAGILILDAANEGQALTRFAVEDAMGTPRSAGSAWSFGWTGPLPNEVLVEIVCAAGPVG
jgi:hypothetical protein